VILIKSSSLTFQAFTAHSNIYCTPSFNIAHLPKQLQKLSLLFEVMG